MFSVRLPGKPHTASLPDRVCIACGNETGSAMEYQAPIPMRAPTSTVLRQLALTLLVVNALFLPGMTLKARMPFGFALFVFSVLGTAAFFMYRALRSDGKDVEVVAIRVYVCEGCQKRSSAPSRAGGVLFLLGVASLLIGLFGSSNGMRFLLAFVGAGVLFLLLALLVASVNPRSRQRPLSFQRRGDQYYVSVSNKSIANRITATLL